MLVGDRVTGRATNLRQALERIAADANPLHPSFTHEALLRHVRREAEAALRADDDAQTAETAGGNRARWTPREDALAVDFDDLPITRTLHPAPVTLTALIDIGEDGAPRGIEVLDLRGQMVRHVAARGES